jgi:hypothetical protein
MDTTENFSHPIKAERVVIHYINSGKSQGARVHAAGCTHRADKVSDERDSVEFVTKTVQVYKDDWYDVAPCARTR